MQLHLYFTPVNEEICLPLHYNHLVQALIYKLMGPHLATVVHNMGFTAGNRSMRLFAFSRLLGKYRLDRQAKTISFTGDVRLIVASPVNEVLRQWATCLASNHIVYLGNNAVTLNMIRVENPVVEAPEVVLRTVSPISVYSTLYKHDGSPYTCYFEPGQPEFNRLITLNLQHKAQALGYELPDDSKVTLTPVGRCRFSLVQYKGGVIKAVSGQFRASGDPGLIQIGLDAGFGAKNSQGFGLCVLKGGAVDDHRRPDPDRPGNRQSWC